MERPNRFLALVEVEGRVLPCFLPNPGRMYELLIPGGEVVLLEVDKQNRKTGYDMIGVISDGELVYLDTRVPNMLVFEALKNGDIEEFSQYDVIKPEFVYGSSRLDFLLSNKKGRCLLEVKSCSLLRDGVALFPDAPTSRGKRHLMELMDAKNDGYRACALFIIQRTKARVFRPNYETDPDFGKTLRKAVAKGVEVFAYCSEFEEKKIVLKGKIKVDVN